MKKPKLLKTVLGATLSLIAFVLLGTRVCAQSDKVEGLIKARNGDTMILQSSGAREVTVLLTESTEVKQKQGMFQVRRKEMAMAALIPGLAVQVEGTYNDQKQLVAKSVTFKGNDLEQAEAIKLVTGLWLFSPLLLALVWNHVAWISCRQGGGLVAL